MLRTIVRSKSGCDAKEDIIHAQMEANKRHAHYVLLTYENDTNL